MRTSLATLMILVVAASFATDALAADHAWPKLDAKLRLQVMGTLPTMRDGGVPLYIKTADVFETVEHVVAMGGTVGTVSGDIVTARLPVDVIVEVAQGTEVVQLEGAQKVVGRLDKVLPAIGADAVQAGDGLSSAYDGSDVLVGVLDYGLDLTHEAFLDDDGAIRVVALWDQDDEAGDPPSGYSYGAVCDESEIADGTCGFESAEDHGTHVTGIAAGAQVGDGAYWGVAPGASIGFVNLGSAAGIDDSDAAFTTAVCDGAAWLFSVADDMGIPAVLNMSIGTHEGPHDGSSLASQCLDNLTGPGKIIVAAAGNEGAGSSHPDLEEPVYVHMTGQGSDEVEYATFLTYWDPDDEYHEVYAYVWMDASADLSFTVGFDDTDGTYGESSVIDSSSTYFEGTVSSDSVTAGTVAAELSTAPDGQKVLFVMVQDDDMDSTETGLLWWISVAGSGEYHGFIDTTSGYGWTTGGTEGVTVDNEYTIGYPAVAKEIFAVGSFVTKNEWTDVLGDTYEQQDDYGSQVTVGALSGFSSRGPTRDPDHTGIKPDITAPGEIIVSALNVGYDGEDDAYRVVVGGMGQAQSYLAMEGTSMASPAFAGVVALMLQADPTLTGDDIRAVLDDTGASDGFATGLPNSDWGRGKVDALAAVAAVASDVPVTPGDDTVDAPGADTTDKEDSIGATTSGGDGDEDDGGCSMGHRSTSRGMGGVLLLLALAGIVVVWRRRRSLS